MNMAWERYRWLELIPDSVPQPKSPRLAWMLGRWRRKQVTQAMQMLTFSECRQHLELCLALDVYGGTGSEQFSELTFPSADGPPLPNPQWQNPDQPRDTGSDFLPPPNSDRPPWDAGF